MAGSSDRNTKRGKLGNRVQRGIWKSAHGWKHPWYDAISRKAMAINAGLSSSNKADAKLDKALQAKLNAMPSTNHVFAYFDGVFS